MFLELEKLRGYAAGARTGALSLSLLADAVGEIDALRARVAEVESVLDRVRCCESACCPQCAEEIAALNLPQP
jgi:hypothetical protein